MGVFSAHVFAGKEGRVKCQGIADDSHTCLDTERGRMKFVLLRVTLLCVAVLLVFAARVEKKKKILKTTTTTTTTSRPDGPSEITPGSTNKLPVPGLPKPGEDLIDLFILCFRFRKHRFSDRPVIFLFF